MPLKRQGCLRLPGQGLQPVNIPTSFKWFPDGLEPQGGGEGLWLGLPMGLEGFHGSVSNFAHLEVVQNNFPLQLVCMKPVHLNVLPFCVHELSAPWAPSLCA